MRIEVIREILKASGGFLAEKENLMESKTHIFTFDSEGNLVDKTRKIPYTESPTIGTV